MKNVVWIFLFLFSVACIGGSGDSSSNSNGSSGDNQFESGECDGFCGTDQSDVHVSLEGAEALFTVQSSDGSSTSSLVALRDSKNVTLNTSSPLFAVTSSGIQGILTSLNSAGEDSIPDLPRLSFVAVSPIGEVFLAFEHPWIYREEVDGVTLEEYKDPWSPSSPFTCQLFVVDQLIGESAPDSSSMNLTCLKNGIEINTWDSRTKEIQFDEKGNAYFAAHVPGNWKDLLWKYSTARTALALMSKEVETIPSSQISEVINANICFKRYNVTDAGGILYTGVTSSSGDCSGDNFFRYITPTGTLQQITSGWWDYTFAPIEDKMENGTATNNYYIGQILFYGPDPLVATTPDWDDSCVFRFDPSQTGSARSTKIADCNIDIWQYINFDSSNAANTNAVQKTRCEEKKSMMGGGNQPKKILLADKLDGDGLNEIYVVGNIYEKSALNWKCDLCTNGTVASYCAVGETLHFEATTAAKCTTAGGTMITTGRCYNNQVDASATGNVCDSTKLPTNWEINGQRCDFNGNSGRDTRAAIARIDENYDGNKGNRIVRLSDDSEIVTDGWTIGKRLAYAAFNSTTGEYLLREVGNTTALLTGIEVYELMQDPRNSAKWFFNGLRFSDNQYVLGTFNPDATSPSSTLEVESGLTGQIDTLVIVPDL